MAKKRRRRKALPKRRRKIVRKVTRKVVRRRKVRKVVRRRRKIVPPKRRRRRVPPKPPKRRRPPEPPEDYGEEWEFGFEYDARGDSSHDVDVNFRVRHKSGDAISRTTALKVMREFARTGGRLPYGFQIAAVNWKHPRKSYKRWRGPHAMREVLSGPLRNVLEAAEDWREPEIFRMGRPK